VNKNYKYNDYIKIIDPVQFTEITVDNERIYCLNTSFFMNTKKFLRL